MKEFYIHISFHTSSTNKENVEKTTNYLKKEISKTELYQNRVTEKDIYVKYDYVKRPTVKEAKQRFDMIQKEFNLAYPLLKEELEKINHKKSLSNLEEVKENIKGLRQEIIGFLAKQKEDKSENVSFLDIHFPCEDANLREIMFCADEFNEKIKAYTEKEKHIYYIELKYKTHEKVENPTKIQQIHRYLDFVYHELRNIISNSKLPGGDLIMFSYPFKTYLFNIFDKLREIEDKSDYKLVKGYETDIKITRKKLKEMFVEKNDICFYNPSHETLLDTEIRRRKQMPYIQKLESDIKKTWTKLNQEIKAKSIVDFFDNLIVADAEYKEYDNKRVMPKRGFETGGEHLISFKYNDEKIKFGRSQLFDKDKNKTVIPWFVYDKEEKRIPLNKFFKTKEDLSALEKWLDGCHTQIKVIGKLKPRWLK